MIKEEALLKSLQDALSPICETSLIFKKDIQLKDLLVLKNATSVINNFITYKLTLAFLERLKQLGFIDRTQFERMEVDLEHTSVNANGFDVLFNDGIPIVAEVKGNVPCKGNRFGANQRKKIIKDLYALKKGKTKSKICSEKYYKFMVLLDDSKNIKEALVALVKSKHMRELAGEVCLVEDASSISKEKINVILITI
ncbi:MAG: hypothetical protein J1F33_01165 [Clostridiales bacterium]|nr:hypothetical protein [Clostridiales bacterium]